jgi:tetratricopeptide (TPR) repeat protein
VVEYDAAIAALTIGIDLLVESMERGPGPPPEQLVQAYIERGTVFWVQGHHEKAMADWEAAVALQPSNPGAQNNLGFAYYAAGQFDEALAQWQSAVELDLSLADSWAGIGITRYGKGQSEDAIAAYQEALALDPSYSSLEWLRYEAAWPEEALLAAAALLSLIERG